MAVSFRSFADVYGSEICDKPTGVADGDVLVAAVSVFDTTPNVPADGVEGFTRTITAGANPIGFGLFYKKITNAAGEPSTYNFTNTSAYTAICISCYIGSDSSPWDTQGFNAASASSPSVNVAEDGSFAVWMQAYSAIVPADGQPAGFTTRSSGDGLLSSDAPIDSGATGALTGSTSTEYTAIGIIKPAGGGGGGGGNSRHVRVSPSLQLMPGGRVLALTGRSAPPHIRAYEGTRQRLHDRPERGPADPRLLGVDSPLRGRDRGGRHGQPGRYVRSAGGLWVGG